MYQKNAIHQSICKNVKELRQIANQKYPICVANCKKVF